MDVVPVFDLDSLLSPVANAAKELARSHPPSKEKNRLLSAAHEAFDLIGGVPRFAIWADQNPTDFYRLYSKTLPTNLEVSGDITIRPALPISPLDEDVP
jgi:hypothetical protein